MTGALKPVYQPGVDSGFFIVQRLESVPVEVLGMVWKYRKEWVNVDAVRDFDLASARADSFFLGGRGETPVRVIDVGGDHA